MRVDFLLERGGKRARRTTFAQEERAIVEADVLDAVRTLKLEVRQAFIDVQLAQENLALARENAASLQEIVTLNQARVRAGEVAEVELLRSRIAALQSQQAARGAELEVRRDRRRLERVIGRTPGRRRGARDSPRSSGSRRSPKAPRTCRRVPCRHGRIFVRCSARPRPIAGRDPSAARTRPDRLHARRRVPTATRSCRPRKLAGPLLQHPVAALRPEPGERGTRARHEDRQADVRFRNLEQSHRGRGRSRHRSVCAAEAALKIVEAEMLTQARDVRTITDYAYRRGEATLIEFLDAQRAFNETMQAWNEARAEYARSVFLVRAAVGEDATP